MGLESHRLARRRNERKVSAMRAILGSRMLTAGLAATAMALLMGFHVVAATDPPARQQVASASSLEGYSCQHPYRVVKDLSKFYNPAQLGKVHRDNPVGPYLNVRANHISASMDIGYVRYEAEGPEPTPVSQLPITSVEFTINWWVNPISAGKICEVKITFHGLPTFIAHHSGGHDFTFHHIHTDRPLRLEITAAR